MPEFKPGDVVHVNGSPEVPMTVYQVDFAEGGVAKLVHCVWFDAMKHLIKDNFLPGWLTKVERSTPRKRS